MNTAFPDPIQYLASAMGLPVQQLWIVFGIIAVWSIVWKGMALWHAARSKQLVWFLVFLIINDLAILEIVYLVWFRKDKKLATSASSVVA